MTRQWWIGVVFVLTLTSVLLARQGVVKTKDGGTFSGDIDEAAGQDSIVITSRGIKTTLPRSSIASIDYAANFEQEYQDRLNKLGANDVKGRIDLAKWAIDKGQYELARKAALDADRLDPHNADAATLLATVQSSLMLEARRANSPATVPDGTDTMPAPAPVVPVVSPNKFLSADEINIIRQKELQGSDDNIRISFAKNVIQRYLSSGDKDASKFNAMTPAQQALEILSVNDPQLNRDIKILNDPASLLEYRVKVQPRLLAGCAASGCHGGPKGGDLFLYPNAEQTAAWYTNFYIVQTYTRQVAGGAGAFGNGPVARGLVDRTQPQSSLLIQYGLPPTASITPHPDVPNWKPIFLTDQDAGYKTIINWMSVTLKPFAPDYGFKFELPKPTTQPSTQPAP